MKLIKEKIYLVLLLVFCWSCKGSETDIESIHILYYNYIFETNVNIDCDEIKKTKIPSFEYINVYDPLNDSTIIDSYIAYEGILETTIRDRKLLKEIDSELSKLILNDSIKNIDSRISAKIRYKNGNEETFCIGGVFTNSISYKGEVQQTSNKLLFLIKNSIGYYKWLSEEDLNNMDELKDTSFVKNPFVESFYYKKYLELQNEKE